LLDKPSLHGNQHLTATVGVQWGIFIALLVALGLLFAGARMRAATHHAPGSTRVRDPQSQPPAEDSDGGHPIERAGAPEESATTVLGRPQTPASAALGDRSAPRPRPRYPPAPGDQMSLEDPPPESP